MYSENENIYGSFIREQEMKEKVKKLNKEKKHRIKKQEFFEQDLKYISHDLDNELDKITSSWEA